MMFEIVWYSLYCSSINVETYIKRPRTLINRDHQIGILDVVKAKQRINRNRGIRKFVIYCIRDWILFKDIRFCGYTNCE